MSMPFTCPRCLSLLSDLDRIRGGCSRCGTSMFGSRLLTPLPPPGLLERRLAESGASPLTLTRRPPG